MPMSVTTLMLTVEPGVLDVRSSWVEFESLAVQLSREVQRHMSQQLGELLRDTIRHKQTVCSPCTPHGCCATQPGRRSSRPPTKADTPGTST